MKKYYINNECGNIHDSFSEMFDEFSEMYDGNDDTNILSWNEYYTKVIEHEDGEIEYLYTE